MQKILISVCSLLFLTAGLGLFSAGYGETYELKFVPKPPKEDTPEAKRYPAAEKLMGESQDFTGNFNSTQRKKDIAKDPKFDKFFKLVKKEPVYTSKYPFRGVLEFGKKQFLFALDEIPKKEVKKAGKKETDTKKTDSKKPKPVYEKLYIDQNGNGDLTDDKPINGDRDENYGNPNYTYATFDSFFLPLDNQGNSVEINFHLRVWTQNATRSINALFGKKLNIEHRTVYASFFTTCFREGNIQLDGKNYRAILVDQNSNGTFNDATELCQEKDPDEPDSKPTCKIKKGDVLYIFPVDTTNFDFDSDDEEVAKTKFSLNVGGFAQLSDQKFLEMQVSLSGDKLTLKPYDGPLGHLANPDKKYQFQAFHKQKKASLSFTSDENGKVTLPTGDWLITGYSMTLGEKKKPVKKKVATDSKTKVEIANKESTKKIKNEQEQAAEVIAAKLAKLFIKSMASPPVTASVTAWELNPEKSTFTIKEKETTTFEFGPPYQVKVETYIRDTQKGKFAYLSLDVTGNMDENCYIGFDGKERPKAKFVITTKDGKEVESGAFEYG